MTVHDEIGALGRAAGEAADRLGATPAQGVHAAIADRVFGALGPVGLPARVLHDGISTAVYAGVRTGVAVGARAAATVATHAGTDPEAVSRTTRGAKTQAVVNGLIGHELAIEDDALTIQMGLRRHNEPLDPADCAPADATGLLCVFVHGLFETEHAWTTGADVPYADLLADRWSALHVRYNTGLPMAENGRRLSALLDEVVAHWPVDVERIALVGHSMGGTVVRVAGAQPSTWRDKLTHVACLGTPHQGAPLEQVVHGAAALLARLPETTPFGRILDQRSPGIRDLRDGIDAGPLLENVRHLFLGATITADPEHPVGLVLGDLLVRSASAAGPRDIEIEVDDQVHLAGLNHFHLLNHKRVFEHLDRFLES